MPAPLPRPIPPDAVAADAARWLARRDRGLSAAEQDAYGRWLKEDSRHAATVQQLEKVWSALDGLAARCPAGDPLLDPDLLAPRRARKLWFWAPLLTAAAAVALLLYPTTPPVEAKAHGHVLIHPGPERRVLADGSTVDLKPGAKVAVEFTPAERRVRLLQGEAYFTVAKNPARPFIVRTPLVAVRAVGTAFSVGLNPQDISVLVTEGRVRVHHASPDAAGQAAESRELGSLGAGEQGVIPLADSAGPGRTGMKVAKLTATQIEHALSWQGLRLEFVDLPMREVAAAFNHYNRKHLVIRDAATAAILVDGNFRADNLDAFVRLLDAGFGVTAFPANGEIILRKTHDL